MIEDELSWIVQIQPGFEGFNILKPTGHSESSLNGSQEVFVGRWTTWNQLSTLISYWLASLPLWSVQCSSFAGSTSQAPKKGKAGEQIAALQRCWCSILVRGFTDCLNSSWIQFTDIWWFATCAMGSKHQSLQSRLVQGSKKELWSTERRIDDGHWRREWLCTVFLSSLHGNALLTTVFFLKACWTEPPQTWPLLIDYFSLLWLVRVKLSNLNFDPLPLRGWALRTQRSPGHGLKNMQQGARKPSETNRAKIRL